MILNNVAWLRLTKEQISARKYEWQCIKKSLKETEILFRGKAYLTIHKKLFMSGEVPEIVMRQIEKGSPGGGDVFSNGFIFYYLWYYPSDSFSVLNELLFRILFVKMTHPKALELLNASPVNPQRLCQEYGYLGPKAELLTRLFNRDLWPNKYYHNGLEYGFYAHPRAVISGYHFLGLQISHKKYASYPYTNFSTIFTATRYISDAYIYNVKNPESYNFINLESIKYGFVAALEFYKNKNEFTDIKANRFIRFRMLDGWFSGTFSSELIKFIDEIALEINYESSWEHLAEEYDDKFIIPDFEFID